MYRMSYYPWLTQNVPQSDIAAQIAVFGRLIEEELKQLGHTEARVVVLPPVDVPQQIEQVVNGSAQIALMNPLGFVFARSLSGEAEAVAVAKRIIDGKVGIVYFAQLYTRRESGIRSLRDAAGRSVGYGLAYSTSNFLMPAFMLRAEDIHPLFAFNRIEFLKGHEVVARAVYEGKVDLGAGHDGVIIDLARQPGFADAGEVLVQVARSLPIPSDPIVVTVRDGEEREALKRAIVSAGNTQAGIEALKIFWGNAQGLEATISEPYGVLRDALKALKLDQSDLLPARLA
jgi:ABC-type phosphate/phosphonate transport system substrate-binding protein